MPTSPTARHIRRPAALLASAALLATGATVLGASTTAANAAEGDASARTELGFTVTTKTSIAGQYQIAESDDTGDLFVTSAQGRPPVTVATLARINPATLEVEQTAELPKLKHGADGTQNKWLSTHGIYVDDSNDNVWVTNTRDNQVSVFDRDSLNYVAGTYDFDLAQEGTITQVAINHPREVVIDEVRNLAYVTAANRGGASASAVTVYSTDVEADEVITPLKQIEIPARANYPVAGEDAYAVTMGLEIDEATGKVYTNDFRADQYYVIDPTNDYAVETHAIPNATVETDGLGSLQPSSIAVDPAAGEIYSVNQTQGTNPNSLNVFDLATNELKYSVETGPRALAVDVDRERGLVYVADFANGSVTVVDARNGGEIIETVEPEGITKSANHLVVAGGSAYMVDKAGATTGTVGYAVNLDTGATETRETTIDSITKITPAAEAEVVAAARVGGKISLKGQGWFNQAGTNGSTVAVKIDRGVVLAPGGGDVWATIDADADGTFSADIALPAGSIEPGTHTLNLLSGTLQEGDTVRSVAVEVEVLKADNTAAIAAAQKKVDKSKAAVKKAEKKLKNNKKKLKAAKKAVKKAKTAKKAKAKKKVKNLKKKLKNLKRKKAAAKKQLANDEAALAALKKA